MRAGVLIIAALVGALVAGCEAPDPSPASADPVTGADSIPRPSPADRRKARNDVELFRGPVERVLAADYAAGGRRKAAAVAADMAKIDLAGAPVDLQTAYIEHVYAWAWAGQVETALTALGATEGDAELPAPVRTYFQQRGVTQITTADAARRQLLRDEDQAAYDVETSWETVLTVAARYDAYPPPSDTPRAAEEAEEAEAKAKAKAKAKAAPKVEAKTP